MTVRAHQCARCSAPLDIAEGATILTCRFCGTKNELERPAPTPAAPVPAAPAPDARPKPNGAAVAIVAGLVLVMLVSGAGMLALQPRAVPRGPLHLEWRDDKEIFVTNAPSMRIDASVFQGNYQLTFHGFPEGTTWKAGDKQGVVRSKVFEIAKLRNVEPELGGVYVSRLREQPLGPKDELVVTLPEGQRGAVLLRPVPAWSTIGDTLKRVENAPVRFEPDPPRRPDRTAVIYADSLTLEVVGPAELLRDVDEIAIPHRREEVKGELVCAKFKDSAGRLKPPVTYRFKETEVVVFDRRTGAEVAKKVFAPEVRCPSFDFGIDDRPRDSHASTREILAWLGGRVKRSP